ncbi:MAG TPA: integron integrase [Sedimentisphaerales bacterium]|nr:integron integrase [Sedimentisphaerales bacterium]
MREALRSRHYSRRTEQTYCHWVKRFIYFHNVRHPAEMGEPEINAFLTHLAVKQKVSASTQNQALSALLFLYRQVIGRKVGDLGDVIRARKPTRLPVVMTREEVKAVLGQPTGDKWLMASLMYGAGLRLMKGLRLRVQDIDFTRNELLVRDGKGAKDRITMLPESVESPLREHLKRVKAIHERDLAEGWGRVLMPDALDRKYPNAPTDWRRQWVFPQENRGTGYEKGGLMPIRITRRAVRPSQIQPFHVQRLVTTGPGFPRRLMRARTENPASYVIHLIIVSPTAWCVNLQGVAVIPRRTILSGNTASTEPS